MNFTKSNLSFKKAFVFANGFKTISSTGLNIAKKIKANQKTISSYYNKTLGRGSSCDNYYNISKFKKNFKKSLVDNNSYMFNLFPDIFTDKRTSKIDYEKISLGNLYYYDYKEDSNISLLEKKILENKKYSLLNSKNFTKYSINQIKPMKKSILLSLTRNHFYNKNISNTTPYNNRTLTQRVNNKKNIKSLLLKEYNSKKYESNQKLNDYLNKNNSVKKRNSKKSMTSFFKTQINNNNDLNTLNSERKNKDRNLTKKLILKLLNETNDKNLDIEKDIKNDKFLMKTNNNFSNKLKMNKLIEPLLELNKEEDEYYKNMDEITVRGKNAIGFLSFEKPLKVFNLHKKLYEEGKNIKVLLHKNIYLYKVFHNGKRLKNKII